MNEDRDVTDLYLRLLKSWNERDAAAMADCFSPDGTMIGFDGSLAEGRDTIRDHLSPIFADHPTAAFVTIIRSVRMMRDAAILMADVGMVPPGADGINAQANARQTFVARRGADGWRAELFQNTPAALHWDEKARHRLTADLTKALRERGPLPMTDAGRPDPR